jgi:hypothetical protein
MNTWPDHPHIRLFTLLDGRRVRLYCRQVQGRASPGASYQLYEDQRGRQWLEIISGEHSHLEEITGGSFEQRVAADLRESGLNKYSG